MYSLVLAVAHGEWLEVSACSAARDFQASPRLYRALAQHSQNWRAVHNKHRAQKTDRRQGVKVRHTQQRMALLLIKQQHALVHPVRPLEAPATQQAMFTACSQHVHSVFTYLPSWPRRTSGGASPPLPGNCRVRHVDSRQSVSDRYDSTRHYPAGQQRKLALLLKARWGSCCPARYVPEDDEQRALTPFPGISRDLAQRLPCRL